MKRGFSLAVLAGIPCQADPRRNIVGVAWNAFHDAENILRFLRDIVYCGKHWRGDGYGEDGPGDALGC